MKLNWNDDLAIGVKEIDEQHKELFKRFGRLLDACNSGCGREELGSLLIFLDEYIKSHFRDEEKLQLACGYPDYPDHCAQHRIFISKFSELKNVMRTDGPTLSLTIGTNTMLIDWLVKHISDMDKKIATFVQEQNPPCERLTTL